MDYSESEIFFYILLALLLLLAILVLRLEIKIGKFLKGKNARSLEDTINKMGSDLREMEKFRDDSIEYLKSIEARVKRSIQAVAVERFNPFRGTGDGGNQSFSTAFINEQGDGAIITSIYSRNGVSVYSKPIKRFESEFELSDEEKAVLARTRESLGEKTRTSKNEGKK